MCTSDSEVRQRVNIRLAQSNVRMTEERGEFLMCGEKLGY